MPHSSTPDRLLARLAHVEQSALARATAHRRFFTVTASTLALTILSGSIAFWSEADTSSALTAAIPTCTQAQISSLESEYKQISDKVAANTETLQEHTTAIQTAANAIKTDNVLSTSEKQTQLNTLKADYVAYIDNSEKETQPLIARGKQIDAQLTACQSQTTSTQNNALDSITNNIGNLFGTTGVTGGENKLIDGTAGAVGDAAIVGAGAKLFGADNSSVLKYAAGAGVASGVLKAAGITDQSLTGTAVSGVKSLFGGDATVSDTTNDITTSTTSSLFAGGLGGAATDTALGAGVGALVGGKNGAMYGAAGGAALNLVGNQLLGGDSQSGVAMSAVNGIGSLFDSKTTTDDGSTTSGLGNLANLGSGVLSGGLGSAAVDTLGSAAAGAGIAALTGGKVGKSAAIGAGVGLAANVGTKLLGGESGALSGLSGLASSLLGGGAAAKASAIGSAFEKVKAPEMTEEIMPLAAMAVAYTKETPTGATTPDALLAAMPAELRQAETGSSGLGGFLSSIGGSFADSFGLSSLGDSLGIESDSTLGKVGSAIGDIAGSTATNAIAGGVGSLATGGSFMNGAKNGAIGGAVLGGTSIIGDTLADTELGKSVIGGAKDLADSTGLSSLGDIPGAGILGSAVKGGAATALGGAITGKGSLSQNALSGALGGAATGTVMSGINSVLSGSSATTQNSSSTIPTFSSYSCSAADKTAMQNALAEYRQKLITALQANNTTQTQQAATTNYATAQKNYQNKIELCNADI